MSNEDRSDALLGQFEEDGVELLMPIIFDSSSEEEEKPQKAPAKSFTIDEYRELYQGALEEMKGVEIHNHHNREVHQETALFQSLIDGKPISSVSTGVDFVDCTMDPQVFKERYVMNGGRPVIIRGVPKHQGWPSHETWTDVNTFLTTHGSIPIRVTEIKPFHGMGRPKQVRIPLCLYEEYTRTNIADDPFYGFEPDFEQEGRQRLLQDYTVPEFFKEDFYNTSPQIREFYPNFRHFIIGGARTGTNLHVDPKSTSAWNTLLMGKKKWAIFPPGAQEKYLEALGVRSHAKHPPTYWWLDIPPHVSKELGMIECLQEAGDTIYVPAGWWHCVLNLDFTIAITENLLQPEFLPIVWPSLCAEWGLFTKFIEETMPELVESLRSSANTIALAVPDVKY